MYFVGAFHLAIYLSIAFSYFEYGFVGLFAILVGLMMRSAVAIWALRYLRIAVALVFSFNILVLLGVTPSTHGLSVEGILLMVLFGVLLVVSLVFLYNMLVYGERWALQR